MEATLTRESVYDHLRGLPPVTYSFKTYVSRCSDLRLKIQTITDGEYAIAKRDVDQLRAELGQPPLPNLQDTLEERKRESVCLPFTDLRRPPCVLIDVFPPRFMHQQIVINQSVREQS
jgi:hypothetical protein